MKVGVIGAGVSGLSAAYLLDRVHDVTLYEAQPRAGGHANTLTTAAARGALALETGFMVFNDRTYPGLTSLFAELGIRSRESEMSFSVCCRRCRLEYSGHGPGGLFASRANLASPGFLRMLADLGRFFRRAPEVLADRRWEAATIGEYLRGRGYGGAVTRHFLAPMGAAIWSSTPTQMMQMPARFFVNFFRNHGLLGVRSAPQWYTVEGGSQAYVQALLAGLRGRVQMGRPVRSVRRDDHGVEIVAGDGPPERHDAVVVATNPGEALGFLADASAAETTNLAAIKFSRNETLLHRGETQLPVRQGARAAWNVALDDCRDPAHGLTMTYYLNRLQRLPEGEHYCVSLNAGDRVAESDVIARLSYDHPLYTFATVAARDRLAAMSGERLTHFAGAYLGWGFHEDGYQAGARAACALGAGPVRAR